MIKKIKDITLLMNFEIKRAGVPVFNGAGDGNGTRDPLHYQGRVLLK